MYTKSAGAPLAPSPTDCLTVKVPLLSWTLSALTAFGRFDSLWVSTDHPAIAERARTAHRGVRVFWRSPKEGSGQPDSVR